MTAWARWWSQMVKLKMINSQFHAFPENLLKCTKRKLRPKFDGNSDVQNHFCLIFYEVWSSSTWFSSVWSQGCRNQRTGSELFGKRFAQKKNLTWGTFSSHDLYLFFLVISFTSSSFSSKCFIYLFIHLFFSFSFMLASVYVCVCIFYSSVWFYLQNNKDL